MAEGARTADLFALPRPAPSSAAAEQCQGCGRRGCLVRGELAAICFLSEAAFDAYLADCARAREAAEVHSMLHWTSFETERFLGRVVIKRGAAAAHRLEAALQLARQKAGQPCPATPSR